MANKRLPDNVLRMQGTYRKDRHGDPDKKPLAASSKAPTCPSWLPASAKAEYRRVVKALAEYGILTPLDRGIMAQYAVLHAHMVDSPETFNAALHGQYRLIQVELGFTPSSRSKLDGLRQDDDDDGDPLATRWRDPYWPIYRSSGWRAACYRLDGGPGHLVGAVAPQLA